MRIFTGRSGSGKTTRILQELARAAQENEGRQILLVPELFSHAYERRLAEATGNLGARTAEVLTFSRLAGRVFAETGGLGETMLSPAGRLLTLRQAASQLTDVLTVYPDAAQKPAVLRELMELLDECKCYGVTAQALLQAADAPESGDALSEKLRDLGRLTAAYDRLCDETLPDPRDALTRLAGALPQSTALDGMAVYLDGFLGFTAQERDIVGALLDKGLAVTAAITCDMTQPGLFLSGCKTVWLLERMAQERGLRTEQEAFGSSRLSRAPDLQKIERDALVSGAVSQPSDGESTQVYAALSPLGECEYAAAYIRRMVRETGACYRDFIVTARDMEPYLAALEMAMARYEVPVYLSEKSDLLQKPPLALVRYALDTVTNGWRYEDLFACLKTGLCALAADGVDRLENYALIWHVRGRTAWEREWTGHPDGYGLPMDDAAQQELQSLNALRQQAAEPFSALADGLRQAEIGEEYARALYAFLEQIGAAKQLQSRAAAHAEAGRLQLAEEYRQLWEIIVDALEQFAFVCGEQNMGQKEFAQLFSLVLSEYDVATIPVSLDRVSCGGMERVTRENVKHLILLGVNDGLLPKAPASAGVLTEQERQTLESMGLTLAAAGAERMLMEQETLYRALACPTETLLLTYHREDGAGNAARPSYLVSVLAGLLEGLPVQAHVREQDSLIAPAPCFELACAALQTADTPEKRAALGYYAQDKRLARISAGTLTRGPLADPETVHGLYGREINLTASRVDRFYRCRFSFFLQYGLKLKPRRQAQFAAPEAGTFLHYVMEHALKSLLTGGAESVSDDEVQKALRAAARQFEREQLGGENQPARFRYLFRRLTRGAARMLRNVLDEVLSSDFRPLDYELDFSHGGDLPPVSCREGETAVALSGKVDRVDGYLHDGRLYVRVMDYKSGKKSFSLSDIWYGLNLQMVLYLFALQQEGLTRYGERLSDTPREILPAGVLYVPVRDDVLDEARTVSEEKLRQVRAHLLRRSGLVSDDMDILDAMEHGLSDGGQYLPVKLVKPAKGKKKKDAAQKPEEPTLSADSAIADLERFGRLARFAQKKLLEMGKALEQGSVEADPFRDPSQDGCAWCEYRLACRFDETAGDRARRQYKMDDQTFWETIGGGTHGDTVDS